jgi:cell division transport system permease protein
MSEKSTKKSPTKMYKQRRRRTLTFVRMFRYGLNNFSRNIWLTVAATAVMSVTLIIILVTLVARNVLLETVADIGSKVDMSVYLSSEAPESKIMQLKGQIEGLDNVKSVRYISASEAREDQAKQNKQDGETLEAIKEAANRLPATLRVYLVDINDTSSLDAFIKGSKLFQEIKDPSKEPSFQGERRTAISRIAEWVKLAEIGGAVMTVVFTIISSLVVFNTIRMAIFNRRDEIQMMKLIGAERAFIRGPFLVEAAMYGFIAAIVATAAGYALVFAAKAPLAQYGLPVDTTMSLMMHYVGLRRGTVRG